MNVDHLMLMVCGISATTWCMIWFSAMEKGIQCDHEYKLTTIACFQYQRTWFARGLQIKNNYSHFCNMWVRVINVREQNLLKKQGAASPFLQQIPIHADEHDLRYTRGALWSDLKLPNNQNNGWDQETFPLPTSDQWCVTQLKKNNHPVVDNLQKCWVLCRGTFHCIEMFIYELVCETL